MELFDKDLDRDVVVVAEIGVNHEGDVDAASRLVRLAAEAGADAVKFQTYTPARFTASGDRERLARVTKFALDQAAHRRLAREAADRGVHFFSTPLTEDVVPFLDELCPAFKIASGDLTFEPVIRAATRTGKPVILSTGAGTVDEIERAVGWVREDIGVDRLADRLVLMHCVSAYPTPVEQANVRAVPYLAERFGVHVGYSNHVIGAEACLAAISLGACVIEVHFTDRKEGRTFRDHALSFEPADLKELVRQAALIRAALGAFGKPVQPEEKANRDAIRKGVVASRDLSAGAVLTDADLMYARPASEFSASERPALIGRRLRDAVGRGEVIARANVVEA